MSLAHCWLPSPKSHPSRESHATRPGHPRARPLVTSSFWKCLHVRNSFAAFHDLNKPPPSLLIPSGGSWASVSQPMKCTQPKAGPDWPPSHSPNWEIQPGW